VKILAVTATEGADYSNCFRSYSEKHSACRGRLHVRGDVKTIDDCCKKGQGYAAEVLYSHCTVIILISIFVVVQQCRNDEIPRTGKLRSLPPQGGVVIGCVCWLVVSFVCSLFRSFVTLIFVYRKYKSDVHKIWHICSASVPNITINYSEVKVKVQGQKRRTEKSSTCNSRLLV